jgi:hypothetical protein
VEGLVPAVPPEGASHCRDCNRGYIPFVAPASWVLLSSRLPRDPTRLRLAVWRRLKRLGAILLNDSLWVLPADANTREALEWLAQEIEEQGGTAWVFEAASLSPEQDRRIVEQFRREADARYQEIGATAQAIRDAALRGRRRGRRIWSPDSATVTQALRQLRGLERALQLERRREYFRSLGRAPAAALVSAAIVELEERRLAGLEGGTAHAVGD